MKRLALLTALTCALSARLHASTNVVSPTLVGIVNLPNKKCALLEVRDARPRNYVERRIFSEGQRVNQVEVLHINPEQGTVEVRTAGTNALLTLKDGPDAEPTHLSSLAFESADLSFVLDLYGGFAGRTVLQHPSLPAQTFSLRASATNRTEVAKVLEEALITKDIVAMPHEEKFALILPKAQAATAKPHPFRKPWSFAGKDEVLPPGHVNWMPAESAQVLYIYADLVGRKVDPDEARNLRQFPVVFKNQTPLTKSELVHALDVLLEWWNIKIVAEGDDLIKPVPFSSK